MSRAAGTYRLGSASHLRAVGHHYEVATVRADLHSNSDEYGRCRGRMLFGLTDQQVERDAAPIARVAGVPPRGKLAKHARQAPPARGW